LAVASGIFLRDKRPRGSTIRDSSKQKPLISILYPLNNSG
jgi:hypothetical protein